MIFFSKLYVIAAIDNFSFYMKTYENDTRLLTKLSTLLLGWYKNKCNSFSLSLEISSFLAFNQLSKITLHFFALHISIVKKGDY